MSEGPIDDYDRINRMTRDIDRSLEETRLRMRPYTVGAGILTAKKFGSCHALIRISESCGLREDLRKAYGQYGDWALASAVSLLQSCAYPTSFKEEMEGNMSRELLGIEDVFHPSMIDELLEHLGSDADGRGELFCLRVARAPQIYSYDSSIVGEDGSTVFVDADLVIMFENDRNGIPVHFTIDIYKSLREMEMINYMKIMRELGADRCTYIYERTYPGSAAWIERMVERGAEFITTALPDTPCAVKVAGMVDDGELHERHGKRYRVCSVEAGIVSKHIRGLREAPERTDDTETMEIVSEGDPKIHTSRPQDRITVWAFRREDDDVEEPERLMARITVIERHLRKLDPAEAIKQFRDVAGRYARFFDIGIRDGRLRISVKQDELDVALNGVKVLYTRGFETWEDVMDCLENGRAFDEAISMLREDLMIDRINLLEEKEHGMSMIRFIALILWCEMSNRLSDAGYSDPLVDVIRWLDTILARGDGIVWQTVGATPRTRRILSALDAQLPKSPMMTLRHRARHGSTDRKFSVGPFKDAFEMDGWM